MTATILFVCPHGAAKSVLAAAYFNHMAQQHGVPLLADSGGTEPSETVAPAVIEMLQDEGIAVSQRPPRCVTRDDLAQAQKVISLGCELEALDIAPERVEQWLDVPAVSENRYAARDAIRANVERLIAQVRASGDIGTM
jgi:arsenate reductase